MISTNLNMNEAKAVRRQLRGQAVNGWHPEDAKIGSPEGLVGDPNALTQIPGSLVLVVKDCGDYLERVYGGWAWVLQPNLAGQVVNLLSMRCHPNWGVVMHMDKLSEVDIRKRWLRHWAGELLERFGMRRAPFSFCRDAYLNAPRDFRGHLEPDLGSTVTQLTKQQKIDVAMREKRVSFWKGDKGREYMRIG